MNKVTVPDIARMKADGRKIPVLTAYSYPVARLLDRAGVSIIMVGDSLGMVEAGYDTTLPVTIEDMIYHTRAVKRAVEHALVVADMPFGTYQISIEDAKRNAVRLVKEGGAEAVKIEGGRRQAETIRAVTEVDVPVMAHIGLTPQSVHRMGGYRVQGRDTGEARRLIDDALSVEEAGAFSIVLEGMPTALAREITERLSIPTIGIGAGPHTDGQVLVINDLLGLDDEKRPPKFVKRYADLSTVISDAVRSYIKDVIEGRFPSEEHSY